MGSNRKNTNVLLLMVGGVLLCIDVEVAQIVVSVKGNAAKIYKNTLFEAF